MDAEAVTQILKEHVHVIDSPSEKTKRTQTTCAAHQQPKPAENCTSKQAPHPHLTHRSGGSTAIHPSDCHLAIVVVKYMPCYMPCDEEDIDMCLLSTQTHETRRAHW